MNCNHCGATTDNGLALCSMCQRKAEVVLDVLPIYFRNLARWRRPNRPKRGEQCTRCGGMLPDCACKREHLAATYDDETPAERIGREAAIAQARAALRGGTSEEDTDD